MAHHGSATIAIDAVGHGFGPLGTRTVIQNVGDPVTFPTGGRGIDQNGDHMIGPDEGFSDSRPRSLLFLTDGVRQTVADLFLASGGTVIVPPEPGSELERIFEVPIQGPLPESLNFIPDIIP